MMPPSSTPGAVRPPERRRTPAATRGPYLDAVRRAWMRVAAPRELASPALSLALAAYARDGRARDVPVETLLRALDIVLCPRDGDDPRLDVSEVRAWAGQRVIRYYHGVD